MAAIKLLGRSDAAASAAVCAPHPQDQKERVL